MSATGEVIANQFARAWAMLRTIITECPATQWQSPSSANDPFFVPARHALHVVETVDYYTSDSPNDYSWGHRFGVDWETAPAENLPAKEDLLAWADEIGGHLQLKLRHIPVSAPSAFPWTGDSVAEHWVYVLRHTQHHVAVLSTILRMRGLPPATWQ